MSKLSYAGALLSVISGLLMACQVQPTPNHALGSQPVQPLVHQPANLQVQETAQPKATVDQPLESARREMRLLDDMYKTSIVLITKHYVNTSDDLPAGEAFKLLFQSMQKKGWHEVRLIDASGEPLNDENDPKEGFEKKAVKELLAGKAVYDEVIEEDGKRFLRAATAVPVVLEKCVMCHDNYKGIPAGQAIGAISYKIPILDGEPKTNTN